MSSVYSGWRTSGPTLWMSLLRACSLHVGAAAAANSLRKELVDTGALKSSTFDEAYAIARLTPGTNLLAMFALLGAHFKGWRGSLLAVAIGTVAPGAIVTVAAAIYVNYSADPIAARSMEGARAGAFAVLMWAGLRLLLPQLERQRSRGVGMAIVVLFASVFTQIPPVALLLGAAVFGAIVLKEHA